MQGVYKITNKLTGQVYIGQSTSIEKRWKHHLGGYSGVGKDICKYGKENFVFEVLDLVDFSDLLIAEQYYIHKHIREGISLYNRFIPTRQPFPSSSKFLTKLKLQRLRNRN